MPCVQKRGKPTDRLNTASSASRNCFGNMFQISSYFGKNICYEKELQRKKRDCTQCGFLGCCCQDLAEPRSLQCRKCTR